MIDYPYQYLPPLDEETRANLWQSIKDQGVLVAIEEDEHGNTLDGHHRRVICEELGITKYPVVVRMGMSEDEKIQYTIDINENRRKPDENNKKFATLKLREQGRSLRRIAEIVGVSHECVRKWLPGVNSVDTSDDDDNDGRIIGKDGKSYPSKRAWHTVMATTQQQADAAIKLVEITGVFDGDDLNVSADKIIDDANKTHYSTNRNRLGNMMTSDSIDWCTPPHIIKRVRDLLGGIDLDPCTTVEANATVKAAEFYTLDDDGLKQDWGGRVFLNPPYGDVIGKWIEKLCTSCDDGDIEQALALVPARTDTAWFRLLRRHPRCFLHGRLQFTGPGDNGNTAPFPSCVIGLGIAAADLARAFDGLGDTYEVTEVR